MGSLRARVYRNDEVKRVLVAIPSGHRHARVAVETVDGIFIFQEATIDSIVRAYLAVVLHPTRRAVELAGRTILGQLKKEGFANYQLLESDKDEGSIVKEMDELLSGGA